MKKKVFLIETEKLDSGHEIIPYVMKGWIRE